MDCDIFTLHHPFSMLVAGPRGAGKSEFVKQLLSLEHYIMMNLCLTEVNVTSVSLMISCRVRVAISTNGRHLNLSVVFVSQSLFQTGKKCRTIPLNSTYIVVFKNPRDQTQIRHLACQMFPSKPKFLQTAYEEETRSL